MPKVKINKDKCKYCLLCVEFCPKKLIQPSKSLNKRGVQFAVFIGKSEECSGCNSCAIMCSDGCIEIEG